MFLSLQQYAAGQAKLPYQYRALVAWILHGFVALPGFLRVAGHVSFLHRDPYLLGLLIVVFFSLLGSVLATRGSIYLLTGKERYSFWSSLILVYLAYFTLSLSYGLNYVLPYDVPSLFFFCLGILLLLKRNYWIYYPVFCLAVMNRETAAFLTVFCIVCEWFRWRQEGLAARIFRRIAPHVVVQLVIWIAIKLELMRLYGHNPSDTTANPLVALKLFFNLRELVKPQQWPLLASVFGFLFPALLLGARKIRDRRIFYGCAIILPLWFAAMMVVAVIVEIRVFNELNAFVAIALALFGNEVWEAHAGRERRV